MFVAAGHCTAEESMVDFMIVMILTGWTVQIADTVQYIQIDF